MNRPILLLVFLLSSCALSSCGPNAPAPQTLPEPDQTLQPLPPPVESLSIIGTNDLHGHIEMLPLLGGYLRVLRSKEERLVLLIDGGDMFQGTLASNLKEGAPIVEAYNLLGYDAVTIGNHEFDFGPVGPDATAEKPGQDPRGALKARAAAANFPFLSSNIFDDATGEAIQWPNVLPATMLERRGIKIGLIGVSTFETPHVTLPANFVGLSMAPLAARIAEHAAQLRTAGAAVIVVTAHAGGHCEDFSDPRDISSCEAHEIMEVASELPLGSVDVIVAGHTHLGMAHTVNGIAIIESYSYGKAFGRVDLTIATDGTVDVDTIHPPRSLCLKGKGPTCDPGSYEGSVVQADATIATLAKKASDVADKIRSRDLGILLPEPILRSRANASALGDLFVDLMRAAQPTSDVAITNGGSLRADLPAGPLKYGGLFQAMPFDNRFAMVRLKGSTLRKLFATNLTRDNGILSVSGLSVRATCKRGKLVVAMKRDNGKPVRDSETLLVTTSDFLASGGDGLIGSPGLEPESITLDGGLLVRDAMAEQLRKRGGQLRSQDFFDPAKPRIRFEGKRPLICQ